MDINQFLLRHPFSCVISGPSGSGKTILARNLLKNFTSISTLKREQLNVIWCFGQDQIIYKTPVSLDVNIRYSAKLPTDSEIINSKTDVIVIDDLMSELGDDSRLASMFTKGSHHVGYSVIFLVQNLFFKSKQMRTITLNAQYIILMKNRRDLNQIEYFGRQLYPKKSKVFLDVYNDATKNPYGYLLIDLRQETNEENRLRSNIENLENTIVYMLGN